ncbi:MAG: prepilin-type N-terminal cleavage/methylation domain-containing protein [Planctomycetes bacterium]|nr:prepilin-type N-terminal cleavage/methylation domain-containing protein [Planctomycetota bacterium]
MKYARRQAAFTLIEMLVAISVIAVLVSLVAPSLRAARRRTRAVQCLSTLKNLGVAMTLYHKDNDDAFWPFMSDPNPQHPVYFWGKVSDPVDTTRSPFMQYCSHDLKALQCPEQPWGSYIAQAGVSEPTTNYGYNAWCLAPDTVGGPRRKDKDGREMSTKRTFDLKDPSNLFVFADSAMLSSVSSDVQNCSFLEPVTGTWTQTPTTQFRHMSRANALCADGRAGEFAREGWEFTGVYRSVNLGFVGTSNVPHYDQQE